MKTEYEAKFLSVDADIIRKNLSSIGAQCTHQRLLMKRVLFDHPVLENAFIRIRDEGSHITMTGKHIVDDGKVDGMKEIEIGVDNFNNAKAFINFIGIPTRSYQETYREKREFENITFTIDEWPGILPFLEIEGENEDLVKGFSDALGLNFNDAYFGAVDVIYETILGIPKSDFNNLKLITFDNPPTHI